MAHSCPECGMVCYCGGDIDDCCFEGTTEELNCKHCDGVDDADDDQSPYKSPDKPLVFHGNQPK